MNASLRPVRFHELALGETFWWGLTTDRFEWVKVNKGNAQRTGDYWNQTARFYPQDKVFAPRGTRLSNGERLEVSNA